MRRNKKKRSYYSEKYVPDVISYYAQQKNQNYYSSLSLEVANEEQIHDIAKQIFGKTYYVDFCINE